MTAAMELEDAVRTDPSLLPHLADSFAAAGQAAEAYVATLCAGRAADPELREALLGEQAPAVATFAARGKSARVASEWDADGWVWRSTYEPLDGPVLAFRSCHDQVGDADLKVLAPLRTVVDLEVTSSKMKGSWTKILSDLPLLTTLNLCANHQLRERDLAPLGQLPRLSHLHLVWEHGDEALAHLRDLRSLRYLICGSQTSRFDQLANVPLTHLSAGRATADAGLADLASIPTLTHLDLLGSSTSDGAVAALRQLPALTHLVLGGVTDSALGHLRGLPLTHLDLHPSSLRGPGLAELAALETLEHVYVEGSCVRDSDFVTALPYLEGVPIRALDLGRAADDATLEVVSRLTSLRHLDILCSSVTARGLQALQRLPELAYLELSGDQIDDACLDALGTLSSLRELRIPYAPALTKPAAARLAEALSGVEVITLPSDVDAHAVYPAGITSSWSLPDCPSGRWVRAEAAWEMEPA